MAAGLFFLLVPAHVMAGAGREIQARPELPPPPEVPLEGRARSYYAFCRSQQAILSQDYETARAYMEEAVQADPESPELSMELARVYLSLRRPEDAMALARKAARLAPADAEPRRFIIDLFRLEMSRTETLTRELLDQVEAAHVDLLQVDPEDGEVRLSLARLYAGQGQYAQAAAILRPHVRIHPEDIDAAYLMARSLVETGNAAEANAILESAVEARPDLSDLRAALAEARERTGDLEGAAALLEDLVSGDPERSDFRFALARIYSQRGDHEAAARQAALLVEKLPQTARGSRAEADLRAALMFLVDATTDAGDLDKALEVNLEAEKRFPGEIRFLLKRAELLYLRQQDDEAEAILSSLARRTDGSTVPRSRLSMVLLRAGAREEGAARFERAESLLRRALQYDSDNHAALNYLGYMLAEEEVKLEEALSLIQRALHLDEDNGAYLDSLGWTLFKLGRLKDAEETLARSMEYIPDEPEVRDHLGDLYWAQGRSGEAVQAWREAIHLGIEDIPAVEAKIQGASASGSAAP
jgi:tetratricopeptide (TPR) repeat protein